MYTINFSRSITILGEESNIETVFNNIKEGLYTNQIRDYRETLKQDSIVASELKKNLPCFTVSGLFESTRTMVNLKKYNQLIHLDYDLKNEDKAREVVEIANNLPYTYCSFISPSYGVKVFIKTDSTAENHNQYFKEISKLYDSILGAVSDSQVKDITRLCFISDDPNLYLNPRSVLYTQYNEEDKFNNLWEFTSSLKTYVEGSRNDFIHLYACNASRWGIEQNMTYEFLANRCPDLSENEVLQTTQSAYKKTISEFGKFAPFAQSAQSAQSSISCVTDNSSGYKQVNYEFDSEDSPMISEGNYSKLPPVLREACEQFNGREKDVFLTGLITTLSSAMHNVTGVYDSGIVYPNLFSFVTAPAASGKSSIKYSKEILKCYHETMRSSSQFGNQIFFIPANNSASKIYEMLQSNGGIGLIFETEADTLSSSMKQEWGSFSDVLRKAFHNENISQARRQNDEYFEVDIPRFSICLTGTNEQVRRLINSTEDGLFSRFLFYSFASDFKWKNTLMDIEPTKHLYFNSLNEEICNMLSNSVDRKFSLTKSQIERFNSCFEQLSEQIYESYPDAVDQVKRAGLKMYKLAMTLSGFRYPNTDMFCEDDDFEFALDVVTKVYLPHQINVMKRLYSSGKYLTGADYLLEHVPQEFSRSEISDVYKSFADKPSKRTISKYLNVLLEQDKIYKPKQGIYKKRL